ncbi:MAG: cache domain-containing protein, partial [Ignavibacteriales bacterium]
MFRFNVRTRLIVVYSLVAILVSGSMAFYASVKMENKMIKSAKEKLKSDLQFGAQYLDQKSPGNWHFEDHKLYKGPVLMEGNFGIVDEIGELTGDTVTIFKADTRVATNVRKEGKRAIGTQAEPQVAEAVLNQGIEYIGEADVAGTKNITAYQPIKDSTGKIIGIWYVGVPATPYDEASRSFMFAMIWFALGSILATVAASWFIANTVAKPLKVIENAVRQASEGDLT